MNCVQECCICMDVINSVNNRVSTECGHLFHTNCLMANVAHNGFGCPYCRSVMATKPPKQNRDEDEDEEDLEDYEDDDEEEEEEDDEDYEMESEEETALRGLRFMFNNLERQPHSRQDTADENEYIYHILHAHQRNPPPSPEFIVQKLVESGKTMLDLVKSRLADYSSYDARDYMNLDDEMYGLIKNIVIDYQRNNQDEVIADADIDADADADQDIEIDLASVDSDYIDDASRLLDFDTRFFDLNSSNDVVW